MSTAMTCVRCTGKDGAHFAFCFVAEVWERLFGDRFPWMPPAETYLPDDVYDWEPPEEPDWDWAEAMANAGADPTLDPDWAAVDPPDPDGVMEDFLVGSGHMESDAVWMPHCEAVGPQAEPADARLHSVEAVTHLPEDYYGPEPKVRVYDTTGIEQARQAALRAMEDASVQFVYDCTETVAGGRVALQELYDQYDQWRQLNDRPSMSKDKLRDLLREMGLTVEPGRLPGMRKSGKPPLLVHGVQLRRHEDNVPEMPRVVVRAKEKPREKHALIGAKPGGELPKQIRELIDPLVTKQGWEYQPHNGSGKGRPRLISPDGKTVTLPSTPHLQGRTLENTRSFLRQNGALL